MVEEPGAAEPETHGGAHVVTGPGGHRDTGRKAERVGGARGEGADPGAAGRGDAGSNSASRPGVEGSRGRRPRWRSEYQPVPEASPGSVAATPVSRSVRKSCGSRTAAQRSAVAGLVLAQPLPISRRSPRRPARNRCARSRRRGRRASSARAAACGAERVSFQSRAGRSGAASRSRTTRPCCCPATAMPRTAEAARPTPSAPKRRPRAAPATTARGSLSRAPAGAGDVVRGASDGERPAGGGVGEQGLGGLGGTVHADDDRARAASGAPLLRACHLRSWANKGETTGHGDDGQGLRNADQGRAVCGASGFGKPENK